jgi:2-polyprenyl-3-methyl-5-hydroxy-6-metoxy-1,4-benzoquinol methylase
VAKIVIDALITAIDWPNVLEVASNNARVAVIEERYKTISGNAFEMDWGGKYDLILMANILHHFDQEGCVQMLSKAKESLSVSGSVFVIDIMPNPDRVSPPEQAAFAFLMLATTPRGDAYVCEEYEAMAKEAGLAIVESRRLPPTPQTLMEFKGVKA